MAWMALSQCTDYIVRTIYKLSHFRATKGKSSSSPVEAGDYNYENLEQQWQEDMATTDIGDNYVETALQEEETTTAEGNLEA